MVLYKEGCVPWNKGLKGVCVAWNKGLTKETDTRVKKIAINKICVKRPPISEETRKKLSNTGKGRFFSEETKQKISLSKIGKHLTEETKHIIGSKNRINFYNKSLEEQERIRNYGRVARLGRIQNEETKIKIRIASIKQWKEKKDDMLISLQAIRDVKPNKFESKFLIDVQKNGFNMIEYVGNGSFWITLPKEYRNIKFAINPDFIIKPFNKTKSVIELVGLYWHNEDDLLMRKKFYDSLGIRCLFITDKQYPKNTKETMSNLYNFINGVYQ